MELNKQIKEIIVVEGKSDTQRLQLFFPNIKTIETNGSAISDQTISLIKHAQEKFGAIVFTDPDFNGNKIRQKIVDAIPEIGQAFISRSSAVPSNVNGSLGIEHASEATLREALKNVKYIQANNKSSISMADIIQLGLTGTPAAKKKREFIGDELQIGTSNTKSFLKKLQEFQISKTDIEIILKGFVNE